MIRALSAPLRVGVLGSTRGSSLQAVLDAIAEGHLNATVALCVSNKEDAGILERVRSRGYPARAVRGSKRSREEFDDEVSKCFEDVGVEVTATILPSFPR